MKVVYVTGNENKARYFSKLMGMDIEHHPADVVEIQSLDPKEVITAKVEAAYEQLQKPVIVEDTSFVIGHLGRLPGTLIKWFLEEIGVEGLCRLADQDPARRAYASAIFAYYDGHVLTLFEGGLEGSVAQNPRGDGGFGWNQIFIPSGANKTFGEMSETEFAKHYSKVKPFTALKQFLDNKN